MAPCLPGILKIADPDVPRPKRGLDAGAAAEHGIAAALATAGVTAYANTAYHGAGLTIRTPFRRSRYDRATGKFTARALSAGQKAANRAHSALRAPGERANADLKTWRILRKIRSSPSEATAPISAVQDLVLNA